MRIEDWRAFWGTEGDDAWSRGVRQSMVFLGKTVFPDYAGFTAAITTVDKDDVVARNGGSYIHELPPGYLKDLPETKLFLVSHASKAVYSRRLVQDTLKLFVDLSSTEVLMEVFQDAKRAPAFLSCSVLSGFSILVMHMTGERGAYEQYATLPRRRVASLEGWM